jgi:hypothetical protein
MTITNRATGGNTMKRDLTTFMLAWALVISVQAIAQKQTDGSAQDTLPPPSAFLPPVGQIVRYRFTDTTITPKESKSDTGTLTLTAVTAHEIKATVAIDNKPPRNFALHVDHAGALSTTPQSAPSPGEQALLLRLSLAAQIGAHPGEETSIPVLLNVPWASGPVNPTLYVKSTAKETGGFPTQSRRTRRSQPSTRRLRIHYAISTASAIHHRDPPQTESITRSN